MSQADTTPVKTPAETPTETQAEGAQQPWDQLAGEPDLWYGRFQVYLELGVTRTFRAAVAAAGRQMRGSPFAWNHEWSQHVIRWHWRARARAWDVHQRDLLALSERNKRLALHGRRVERMEDYLDAVCEVLDTANMPAADEKLAREWLPQMRVFLRDLLVAERQEFERGDYERSDPDAGLVITADDLRAAQRALTADDLRAAQRALTADDLRAAQRALTADDLRAAQRALTADDLRAAQRALAAQASSPAGVVAFALASDPAPGDISRLNNCPDRYPAGRTLLVCIGPDSALMLDLAALRAVRSATGLAFKRIVDTSRPKFAGALRRERNLGRPVELLHLALHASPDGVEFADGVADGNWLSERLFGVRIMLLASCRGDSIGDWLGVVPHVITLSEDITHEDAAVLTQHFWHNIGLGMDPGPALDEALTHCPPAVSEYVVRHW